MCVFCVRMCVFCVCTAFPHPFSFKHTPQRANNNTQVCWTPTTIRPTSLHTTYTLLSTGADGVVLYWHVPQPSHELSPSQLPRITPAIFHTLVWQGPALPTAQGGGLATAQGGTLQQHHQPTIGARLGGTALAAQVVGVQHDGCAVSHDNTREQTHDNTQKQTHKQWYTLVVVGCEDGTMMVLQLTQGGSQHDDDEAGDGSTTNRYTQYNKNKAAGDHGGSDHTPSTPAATTPAATTPAATTPAATAAPLGQIRASHVWRGHLGVVTSVQWVPYDVMHAHHNTSGMQHTQDTQQAPTGVHEGGDVMDNTHVPAGVHEQHVHEGGDDVSIATERTRDPQPRDPHGGVQYLASAGVDGRILVWEVSVMQSDNAHKRSQHAIQVGGWVGMGEGC